jgi:tRNA/rRNA methyltransferase
MGPAIILVRPQLGENIGTAARAMLNCTLTDLRIVEPRDGWPNANAIAASSGADAVVNAARIYDTTAAAIADLNHVFATTARRRDMLKPVLTPRSAAPEIRRLEEAGAKVGVLFGMERKGLHNDDVALAEKIIEAPLNPDYMSLNLAQAVLMVAYEWHMAGIEAPEEFIPGIDPEAERNRPATHEELVMLFEHLEGELDEAGFLFPPHKRPVMVRSIRNMLLRARLTDQEVRTLRGVIAALTRKKKRNR